MANRGWMKGAILVAVSLAAYAGCSSDSDQPPAAATGGSGGDAAVEAAGSGGSIFSGGSAGSAGKGGASDDGGDAAPGCSIKNLDFGKDCNECGGKQCCEAMTGCDNDPVCVALVKCVQSCPITDAGVIDTACVQACAADAGFSNYYNPLTMCLGNTDGGESCGNVCPF
jgi:hypothetical protein